MRYTLLIAETPEHFGWRNDPRVMGDFWAKWSAYSQAVNQAGIFVAGAALLPPEMGTTVKVKDGKRHVQDGPYADTKEQLGGVFIIDVPDLDTALDWAAKCPAAEYSAVEVRPVLPMQQS